MRSFAILVLLTVGALDGCGTPLSFKPQTPIAPQTTATTTPSSEAQKALAESPLNLVANPGATQIVLTWDAAADFGPETVYVVTRKSTSGSFADIAQTQDHTFTDSAVAVGSFYYYIVYALVGPARSVGSKQVMSEALALFADWNEARYFPTLRRVVYAPSRQSWLAVGDRGRIELAITSPQFTNVTTEFTADLTDAASGPAGYVAVATGGLLVTSPDGNSWTQLRKSTTGVPSAALFDGTRFIVMNGCRVSISLDVRSWADLASCSDGIRRPQARRLMQEGSGYLALADDGIWRSTDLINWTEASSTLGLEGLTVFGDTILAAGCSGTLLSGGGEVAPNYAAVNQCMHAASHSATQYMVAGDGGHVLASSNGTQWNDETAALLPDERRTLYDIVATDFDVVAVGEGDTVMHRGISEAKWTPVQIGDPEALVSVASTSLRAMAVGAAWQEGIVLTSVDGLSWARATTVQPLHAVTLAGDTFTAVGDKGFITRSKDGLIFDTPLSPTSLTLRGVARGFGTVAVGDAGTIIGADDDKTFEMRTSATAQDLSGIAWGNSLYLAVGKGGTTVSSPDGHVWKTALNAGVDLVSLTFAAGQFIAVGSDGAVYVTLTGASWAHHKVGPGIVGATVDGETALAWGGHMLYVSKDFTTWIGKDESQWRNETTAFRFLGHLMFFGSGEQIELLSN